MAAQKTIAFDVLGTCFAFSTITSALSTRLSSSLQKSSVDAHTLTFAWFYAAQRDYTYLSNVGSYTPIASVLKATLPRACLIVGLPRPSDDGVGAVMQAVKNLAPREGLKDLFDGLKQGGWDVYAVTNGGMETSLGYYRSAGTELDEQHVLSCDSIQVAKPDAKVYENVNAHYQKRGIEVQSGEKWFVAAHAWDLIAARKAGFKTAYLDFEEGDPVTELFGEFDVYASSMKELLEKMGKV